MKPDDFPIPLRPNRAIELSAAFVHERRGDRRLDYSIASLRHLDTMVDQVFPHLDPRRKWMLALLMSFYLGEVILRHAGAGRGTWIVPSEVDRAMHGDFPVHLELDGRRCCPYARVSLCVADNEAEGLVRFAREMLREPLEPAPVRRSRPGRLLARLLSDGAVRAATI